MNRAHLIDCHVLTLPRFPAQWVDEMRGDLDAEPVNQHWLPGIDGRLGEARAAGYALGCAPFVSSADPDDRITPGTFAALQQALQDNPCAPFAWAGEQLVWEDLRELPPRFRHVWRGYSPMSHVYSGVHVHGVKLYRRALVMPLLDQMRQAGPCCEFLLDLAIIKPHTKPPRSSWPVHVPIVGRLWRQHGDNGSRDITVRDFDRAAQVLGFESMAALRSEVATAWHGTSV
jgi:hypothetical protein